jgi:hypothetical protein
VVAPSPNDGVWIPPVESCRRRHRWCGNCGLQVRAEVTAAFSCGPQLCWKADSPWMRVDGRTAVILRPPRRGRASTCNRTSSTVVHRHVHRCEHSSHGSFRLGMRLTRESAEGRSEIRDNAVTGCTVCPLVSRSAGHQRAPERLRRWSEELHTIPRWADWPVEKPGDGSPAISLCSAA